MILIAAIGKMRPGPELELFTRYQTRIRPKLAMVSLRESRGPAQEVRLKDAAALLDATRGRMHRIALDEGGEEFSSQQFAELIEKVLMRGQGVAFMIGGAEGLDRSVLEASANVMSLGRMTWPHMLARVMLTEQIYRARTISAGHPYHRDARP